MQTFKLRRLKTDDTRLYLKCKYCGASIVINYQQKGERHVWDLAKPVGEFKGEFVYNMIVYCACQTNY